MTAHATKPHWPRTKTQTTSTLCCKLILVRWYVHVSDLPSSPLRLSSCFVRVVYHALRCSSFLYLDAPCAAFFHVSYSFMHCIHPCSPSIHASYLFICRFRSCATLCLSFHVSATQLGASLTCSSP